MRTLIAVGCLLVALMAVAVSAANPEEHTDEEQMPEVHSQGKYGRKKFKRVCIKRCKVIRKHFKRYYDEVAQLMDDAISQDDDMDEVSDQDVGEVEDQDDSEQDLAVMQSPMPYGYYGLKRRRVCIKICRNIRVKVRKHYYARVSHAHDEEE